MGQSIAAFAFLRGMRSAGLATTAKHFPGLGHVISAGGDIVLTVNPTVLPAMVSAVSSRAAGDATFRSTVAAAVMRVLTAKAAEGLLAPRLAVDGILGPVTVAPCSAGSVSA
jgi:beta-glucosidase-like glycosyl hydrolase